MIHQMTDPFSNHIAYLASLISKTVKTNWADGEQVEGVMVGIIAREGHPRVLIGDKTVDLTDVYEVTGETK